MQCCLANLLRFTYFILFYNLLHSIKHVFLAKHTALFENGSINLVFAIPQKVMFLINPGPYNGFIIIFLYNVFCLVQ